MQTTTLRRTAAALALAATLTGLAVAPALAAEAPSYDFSDCPAIPAGVDAAQWKCEVLTATGSLHLGSRDIPELAPMTITHAEGPLPDGSKGQVWGALRGGPTPVPGGLTGHGPLPLALQPEYGGRSDFYSVGDRMGLFTLRYRVVSPLLPEGCVIGTEEAPIEIRLRRVGSSEWISKNPPVIKFAATDTAFTAPAATDCGPLTRLVNHRLGLPAQTGNTLTLSALYTFKTYDQLPPR
ncbi:hypothetical protein OOK31_21325 [Streptomyces sp. NBC_00249]|uniref:hypothetical protein n=1 Tax=Streptomyces sp. NBC_00249 TaxID=2975690 RepID=UPI00225A477E|nr:hypothetical protein [Streptomyces sp. NBC_00249]MCX5196407.1 hypothetical protein [Streptomyces sp. NBC_00249]